MIKNNTIENLKNDGLLASGYELNGIVITGVIRSGQSNSVYSAISKDGIPLALKEYYPRKICKRMPSGRLGVADEKAKRQFENGVSGFVNEAVFLAEIKSDLLARYVDAFRDNGTAYLATVMEPGDTLEGWARKIMRSSNRPSEADLRFIFWTLLNAVQVMHDKGFLHLDIKPSNVIMRDENTPILIDLGGARRFPYIEDDKTSASNYTPGFAALEQHVEDVVSLCPGTDIYGIGASTLYCMTGKVPQTATERAKEDHLEDVLKKCGEIYSENLLDIVRKCLSLSLSERHSSLKVLQNLISSR